MEMPAAVPAQVQRAQMAEINARLSKAMEWETYISDESTNPAWYSSSRRDPSKLSLFIQPQHAKTLLSLGPSWRAKAERRPLDEIASSLYMLAHERGHAEHGFVAERDNELLANQYAAQKFIYYARRLGLSRPRAALLYRSLPAHWRRPTK